MVYVLRHVLHGEALILGLNKTYTLGRSRRNNIHLTDTSVAQMHAILEITRTYAHIKDLNSEHGTWVNKQKITGAVALRNGDVIVFGTNNCKYVFLESQFEVFIDPNISKTTRSMLAQTLEELNIKLAKTYSKQCTHYVVEHVSLDILKEKRMLHHLINRMTIVTPKYFMDILTNIKEAPLMPNIYRYMPEVDTQLKTKGVVDIEPRKKRRHIFESMIFIFFNEEDIDLTNLMLKCDGDTLFYSQQQDFFKTLFKDTNRHEYIAVNHREDNKIPPQMSSFLKTMRVRRKKVSCISLEDLYISVLKGNLVGVYNDLPKKTTPKEPQPSTSQHIESINLDSSEDERSGEESESVDIVCQIVKSPFANKETVAPITTFSRLAAAYKEQKTLKETVLETQVSAPTLNRWINRFKTKNVDGGGTAVNDSKQNKDHDQTKLSSDDETQSDLGENAQHVCSTPKNLVKRVHSSPFDKTGQCQDAKKRKPNANGQYESTKAQEINSKLSSENKRKGQDEQKDIRATYSDSKRQKNKKLVVVNPYALKNTHKPAVPEKQSISSTLDSWIKRYKNTDIIPMT